MYNSALAIVYPFKMALLSPMQAVFLDLGAEGVCSLDQPHALRSKAGQGNGLPDGTAAVGRAFELYFAGGNTWVRGEVLAYSATLRAHLVLYEDGESEWLDASMEAIRMLPHNRWVPGLPRGGHLLGVMCMWLQLKKGRQLQGSWLVAETVLAGT